MIPPFFLRFFSNKFCFSHLKKKTFPQQVRIVSVNMLCTAVPKDIFTEVLAWLTLSLVN